MTKWKKNRRKNFVVDENGDQQFWSEVETLFSATECASFGLVANSSTTTIPTTETTAATTTAATAVPTTAITTATQRNK